MHDVPAGWTETVRGVITPVDCDVNNHMNVIGYFTRFCDASGYLMKEADIYYSDLVTRGLGLATIVNTLHYQDELADGDRFVVHSGILRLGKSSIRYVHKLMNATTGSLCASSDMTEVQFDLSTRSSSPWDEQTRQRIEAMVVALSPEDQAWFDGGR